MSDAADRRAYQRLNKLRKVNLFPLEQVENYPGEIPVMLRKAFEIAESNGLSLTQLASELACKPARVRMSLGDSDARPHLMLV